MKSERGEETKEAGRKQGEARGWALKKQNNGKRGREG
jgi:hypothetical protein